jgi:hypothetical protein
MRPSVRGAASTWVSGLATGNAWVAAGAPLLWWGAALAVPRRAAEAWLRRIPLSFHLFQTTRPISGIDYSLNRWLLVALAAALIIAAGWLLQRQQPTSR